MIGVLGVRVGENGLVWIHCHQLNPPSSEMNEGGGFGW